MAEVFRKCEQCGGNGTDGHDREEPPNKYECPGCDGVGFVLIKPTENVKALVCEVRQGNIGEWHTSRFELSIDQAAAKIAAFVEAQGD